MGMTVLNSGKRVALVEHNNYGYFLIHLTCKDERLLDKGYITRNNACKACGQKVPKKETELLRAMRNLLRGNNERGSDD